MTCTCKWASLLTPSLRVNGVVVTWNPSKLQLGFLSPFDATFFLSQKAETESQLLKILDSDQRLELVAGCEASR